MQDSLIALFERDLNRLKTEIELTSDKDLWKAPDGITNSIGNLSLHLCGNLNHFIGAILGHTGYVRQRENEFADKNIAKGTLINSVNETMGAVSQTIANLGQKDLTAMYPQKMWNKDIKTEYFLIHLQSHLNYHLGQINYLRRLLSTD